MKKSTLFAVYIGINAYENCRQLNGCINDVLAMHRYFSRLCLQQPPNRALEYKPKFLLLPHREEKRRLKKENISYSKPTRQNVIDSFTFFDQADPENNDYCLFYYSGHGSYVDAPGILRPVAPDGTLQTLVCADSRSKKGRDLLDKEIGYLIAKTLEGKTNLQKQKGVHFLAIFDSCHSGTVSRGDDDLVARMEQKGKPITKSSQIVGFSKTGNVFYKPFAKGQKVISKNGLKHGRYINLSACRDSEVAQERILDNLFGSNQAGKQNQGVFSFSLLRTLERSGTDLSYSELIRRVQMEVRTRVGNQIPVLGKTQLTDDDLFFFKNQVKTPAQTFAVGCRETPMGWEWYLDGGAINGLLPSTPAMTSQIKMTDGSERIVDVTFVKGLESLLDEKAFTQADRDKNLEAVIHQMAFEQITLAYSPALSAEDQKMFDQEWSKNDFHYIRKASTPEEATYRIKLIQREGQKAFMLARKGSDMPVFLPVFRPGNFLKNAEQVGKWENTLLLKNQDTRIPRSDIRIHYQSLEGFPLFDAGHFQKLKNYDYCLQFRKTKFSETAINPDVIHLRYKKEKEQFLSPALSIAIENSSGDQNYWVGALYLDSAFGITSKNLEVQELKAGTEDPIDLEYRDDRQGLRLPFIPIYFDPYYHEHGLTEITDYLMIVVAKKPFSLDDFEQTSLPLSSERGQGVFIPEMKEDDWFTIKIPIHISYPLEQVQLRPGETQALTRTYRQHNYSSAPTSNSLSIKAPLGFAAKVSATTSARAKRVVEDLSSHRSTLNQRSIVPPGSLFQGAKGKTGVFCNSLDVEPDQQLSILELTEVKGSINSDQPLKIYPGSPLEMEETILPYGYDEEADIYFPLGYTNGDGIIIIEQLPKPSDTVIGSDAVDQPLDANDRSIKRSIKLFFNKLVWSKLSGHHEYQILSLVKTGEENEERLAYYGTESADDREVLVQMREFLKTQTEKKGSDRVLLLIHGIIGNTDAQVQAVFKHTKIQEHFAAVFTFDYENLNTPIEQTAKHLAKCGKDLGLQENQLTIIAHSMGGLVSRYMIEQEGMDRTVRRLVQAGTPNAGSELADFRKKISGWIGMGINGVSFIQPYLTILSFIGKGLEKRIFKTLNQMGPGSKFLTKLNSPSATSGIQSKYVLIAGDTNLIKAKILKKDPMWKKLLKALKKRGAYLFLDYLVFDEAPNDMAVKVESMKVLPDPDARVEVIDCNHMMYFTDAHSLQLLEELTV